MKFCEAQIGEETLITQAKSGFQEKASWGDTFQFKHASESSEEMVLRVFVQWPRSNELIGEARVPISQHNQIPRRFAVKKWYSLMKKRSKIEGRNVGEIAIIAGFFEEGASSDFRLNSMLVRGLEDSFYDKIGATDIYKDPNRVVLQNQELVQRILKTAQDSKCPPATPSLDDIKETQGQEQLSIGGDDLKTVQKSTSRRSQKKIQKAATCFARSFISLFSRRLKKKRQIDDMRGEDISGTSSLEIEPKSKMNMLEVDQSLERATDTVNEMRQMALKMKEMLSEKPDKPNKLDQPEPYQTEPAQPSQRSLSCSENGSYLKIRADLTFDF
jgi:hypothetical protein